MQVAHVTFAKSKSEDIRIAADGESENTSSVETTFLTLSINYQTNVQARF